MPFITVHHPDRPDSTHQMDQYAFEHVWKAQGYKEGEFKKPSKSSSKKKKEAEATADTAADAEASSDDT